MENEKTKKTGTIVTHTHWDREWRYPLWENRMYLADVMDELIAHLEENPDYAVFLLDGQVVPVLDYLQVRPNEKNRLLALVQAGRIQIGPWYTLPDLYPVSGESLVRNLLRGHQLCAKLGAKPLSVGYESFGWGQPSQFPQIYVGFGIDTVIVSKNISKTRAPKCEFIWRGKDGTEVLATRLGNDARANFFMNTYLEAVTSAEYKTENYRYNEKTMGMVYHAADKSGHVNDYFRLEDNTKVDAQRAEKAFWQSWRNMDDTLLQNNRILMSGTDSTSCQTHLGEVINAINTLQTEVELKHGNLETYVDEMKDKLRHDELTVAIGELRDGPSTSLSANALMTRPHLKQLNREVEKTLYNCAEPYTVAAKMLGARGEDEALDLALNYLLLSHPHDSINGVTQDKTVDDVLYRLNQSKELAEVAYTRACQSVLRCMDFSNEENGRPILVVFNPLPFPRREVMQVFIDTPQQDEVWDFELQAIEGDLCETCHISRMAKTVPVSDAHARPWPMYADRHEIIFDTGEIPAGGYRSYRMVNIRHFQRTTEFWALTRKTNGLEIATSPTVLENEYLRAEVQHNGTLNVLDKSTGSRYENLNYFESTGDVGDYWMYYPPYKNQTYTSIGQNARIWLEENTSLSATIAAEIKMELPAHGYRPEKYHIGESRRSSHTIVVTITTRYTLKKGFKQIDIETEVQNTAKDHRMRVVFDTGIQSETVFAEGHFCVDERTCLPMQGEDGRYYNELVSQPMQDFVCREDEKCGFAILNRGMCEYEALPGEKGALSLTLFRAVRNIICTEQRSMGEFPNQNGGQFLQTHKYNYAVKLYKSGWEEAGISKAAQYFGVPAKPVQTSPQLSGRQRTKAMLPAFATFYELTGGLRLSALKQAENGKSIIARIYNPEKISAKEKLIFYKKVKEAHLTNMKEERLQKIELKNGTLELTVKPDEILTVEVVLEDN